MPLNAHPKGRGSGSRTIKAVNGTPMIPMIIQDRADLLEQRYAIVIDIHRSLDILVRALDRLLRVLVLREKIHPFVEPPLVARLNRSSEQERTRERRRTMASVSRPVLVPLEAHHVADSSNRQEGHPPVRSLVDASRFRGVKRNLAGGSSAS